MTTSLTPELSANEVRKYAGKYESVEALEEGYRHSSAESLRLKKINDELEAKLKNYTPPEQYELPENVTAPDESVALLSTIAREANMTQPQFQAAIKKLTVIESEKLASARASKEAQEKAKADALAALNAADVDLVKEFADKNLPKPLADALMDNITSQGMLDAAKGLRAKMLNNQLPGVGAPSPAERAPSISDAEVEKARDAWNASPLNISLKEEYIRKVKMLAEMKQKRTA